jgi:RHS repeat-associated protein
VKRTTLTLESGSSSWFVWGHAQSGQWGLLEERDSSGDLVARYVHGERIDEILRREGPEGTVFYHHDALGSTIALTDPTGNVVEQYHYDVYGLPTILDASGQPFPASSAGNRFLFTGREWLPELGLYDFRNRVYSPLLGRWLQPDPIGFSAGDVNLYRYCGNGSVDARDPFGLVITGTDEAMKLLREARDYLGQTPAGLALKALCDDEKKTYFLGLNRDGRTEFQAFGDGTRIEWDPGLALYMPHLQAGISPALILGHEAGHAVAYDADRTAFLNRKKVEDPEYTNMEESRNMRDIEQPSARVLGEGVRKQHFLDQNSLVPRRVKAVTDVPRQ